MGDEPSPTIATTEPEVSVEQTEETSATEARLRTIVIALAGLGGALVVANVVFWFVTRPARRVEDDDSIVEGGLMPAATAPPMPDPVAGDANGAPPAPSPAAPATAGLDSANPPAPEPSFLAPAPPGKPAEIDEAAAEAARSLFDRLSSVPDMER